MSVHPDIRRKQDEAIDLYLIRLGDTKDAYSLSWNQVADIMNEETSEDFTESKWRKDYALMKKGYNLGLKIATDDDEILSKYEEKELQIKLQAKKVQSYNVEFNRHLREQARKEILWEQIKDAIVKLPVPDFQLDNFYPVSRKKVGVLSFADIHFSKYFKSISNEYNEDIAKDRMQNLLYETLNIVNQQQLGHIHIINGADSIEGMSLRISQLQSIRTGFVDQTINFCKFISSWLNELSKFVKVTYNHIPSSNHSEIRPFNSGRGEYPAEDLEKVIMHYVHDVLEDNPNIEVPIYDRDYVKLDILGYNVWALHGHQLKGKKHAIRDLSLLHREFIDYLYIAHFHHTGSLTVGEGVTNDIEIIQVPSVMGSDTYADSLMTGAKAGAIFDIYEDGRGRTINYKITLN